MKHQSIIQGFGCIRNFFRKLFLWFSKSKASVQKGPPNEKLYRKKKSALNRMKLF